MMRFHLDTHQIVPAIGEPGKTQQQHGGPFNTQPQSRSHGPSPLAPQLSPGFGLGHFSLLMFQWPPNWSSGLWAHPHGVIRASSQKPKTVMSLFPVQQLSTKGDFAPVPRDIWHCLETLWVVNHSGQG